MEIVKQPEKPAPAIDPRIAEIEEHIKMLKGTIGFVEKNGWLRCNFHAPDEKIYYVEMKRRELKHLEGLLLKIRNEPQKTTQE